MSVKNKVFTFSKMIKDTNRNKTAEGSYYHAHNIRFVSTSNEILGGFHFEKGNRLLVKIPKPEYQFPRTIHYQLEYYNENDGITNIEDRYVTLGQNSFIAIDMTDHEVYKTYNGKVSGEQQIIGWTNSVDGIIIMSTDNNGFDCVWLLSTINDSYELSLMYMRDMGLSTEYPVEILNNYENELVDKIYWVDSVHQLRHLNLKQSVDNGDSKNLIDMEVSLIEAVSSVNISQPKITSINYGGTHTAGMIQYTYVLYKMNGSQTSFAPPSELIPLGKGDEGGGEVNEIVGTSPTITITDLDTKYDNILVYAIKYTSLDMEPQVSVIEDRSIPSSGKIEVYDDGSIIYSSSLAEIKLINNSLNFPKTISSKDNSLFTANFKENNFKLDMDLRLYQFENTGTTSRVMSDISLDDNDNILGNERIINPSHPIPALFDYPDDPDDKFDNINPDYDKYAYRNLSPLTRGADGKYAYLEVKYDTQNDGRRRYLKDNEIYRCAIRFYNEYGQTTLPMWLCDFKAPQGNLEGRPNIIKVGLKPTFYTKLSTMNLDTYGTPIGYEVLIAKRNNSDKTIIASGLINPMTIINTTKIEGNIHETYDNGKRVRLKSSELDALDNKLKSKVKVPNPGFRNSWLDESKTDHEITWSPSQGFLMMTTKLIDSPLQKAAHYRNLSSTLIEGVDTTEPRFLTEFPLSKEKTNRFWNYQDSKTMQLYCPEAIFTSLPIMPAGCDFKVRYAYKNTENYLWKRIVDTVSKLSLDEWKIKNRLAITITFDTSTTNAVEWLMVNGNPYESMVAQSQNHRFFYSGAFGPQGWSSSGMFSNFWGDKFGDIQTDHVSNVQLFYRRYGYTRDESNYSTPLAYETFDGSQVVSFPDINISIQGLNISKDESKLYLQTTTQLLEDNPSLDTVFIKTTVTNESTTSLSPDNTINITSGLNGVDSGSIIMNQSNLGAQYVNETTISKDDLILSPTIINEITLVNQDDINDVNSTINVEVHVSLFDSSNVTILSQTKAVSNSYTLPSKGSLINGGITQVNPMDGVNPSGTKLKFIPNHIIKPEATGPGIVSYKIYGRPEVTKRGQSGKDYNGDGYFKYANTLMNLGANDLGGKDNSVNKTSMINSVGNSCVTFVLNPQAEDDNKNAIAYEDLIWNAKFKTDNAKTNLGSIYGEIVRSKRDIYLGGIYGGNTYEDRKRTDYIAVGDYKSIDENSVTVYSPGDTYVQDFRFLRIIRGDVTNITPSYTEHEEILEYLTETTVDLMNRNDKSFTQWDSDFSYSNDDYHKYNRVYSQTNTITQTRDLDYNFKPVNYFNASVRGSFKKTNGEVIDSWLKPLVNDAIDLDGKFGPINRLLYYNDNIFTMQDRAVSLLKINPKVQYTDMSGAELQLGTGKLLDDYEYISTTKGSLQWNCISTEAGIFFVDIIDKSINGVSSKGVEDLTVVNGFKHFIIKNINFDEYKRDNPIINDGISLGYDNTRGDIYITFTKPDDTFTLCYNTIQNGFSSFYDYNSTFYIPHKGELFTVNPTAKGSLYKAFAGKYNRFYGVNRPSIFEFVANPEPLIETTFNNLEYKDEALNHLGEEVVKSFETIQVENEFQDSGKIELKPKFNIRKLNRKWRLNIPRDKNKIHRMRNTWAKIRLTNNNLEGYNHKVNDIILFYTPNYKKIT